MHRRCFVATLALVLGISASASAQSEEGKTPGVPIGEKAPTFSLKDQDGKSRSLSDFLGEGKKVALVFYRSADW